MTHHKSPVSKDEDGAALPVFQLQLRATTGDEFTLVRCIELISGYSFYDRRFLLQWC